MNYLQPTKTNYSVSDFLSWQKAGTLRLSPSFQRRPVWPATAKSLLIDSIVRGYPIPIIFLREQTDLNTLEPIREVVDGQQRLRTLITFVHASYLRDYDPARDDFTVKRAHNSELVNKAFSDLDETLRHRILNYKFSVHVLPSDTEDREVLKIFARLNSTGIKLNPQELRNAEFAGEFKSIVYDLAFEQLTRWRDWRIFNEATIARMEEVELTSDIAMLVLRGEHAKSQPAINSIYEEYEDSFPQAPEVSARFRGVMNGIEQSLGDHLANTQFRKKTLFYTLCAFFYDIMYGLDSDLKPRKPKPIPRHTRSVVLEASDLLKSPATLNDTVNKALRGAITDLASRKALFDFIKSRFKHARSAK